MTSGEARANARTARWVVVTRSTIPTARFHPRWRLGNAAYWFVRPGGCRVRYAFDCSVTVSTRPSSRSRGGATGTSAKKRKPMAPETKSAFRRRK
jgi:hypothetical protein